MGKGQWSHTSVGKQAVVDELFGAVAESVTPAGHVVVSRIIADGAGVV